MATWRRGKRRQPTQGWIDHVVTNIRNLRLQECDETAKDSGNWNKLAKGAK